MQHGPLQTFILNLNAGQALVRYSNKEEAMKAQKSLNTCVLGNTTIIAEFVSESEAGRLLEQLNPQVQQAPLQPPGGGPMSGPLSNLWSQSGGQNAAPYNNYSRSQSHYAPGLPKMDVNQWNGATAFGGSGPWGGGGLWGGPLDDHHLLQGDILGGQHM